MVMVPVLEKRRTEPRQHAKAFTLTIKPQLRPLIPVYSDVLIGKEVAGAC
jgi:hypothetical protein